MQSGGNWHWQGEVKRSMTVDRLSEHTRDLKPLAVGDNVMVQNLLGNNPKRWDKRGIVLEVLPNRQYKIKMDGSRRISLRNRKHLKKFKPVVSEPNNPLVYGPAAPVNVPQEVQPEVDLGENSAANPVSEPVELPQMMYEDEARDEVAPTVPTTPLRNVFGQYSYSPVYSTPQQPVLHPQAMYYTPPSEQQGPPVCTPAYQSVPVQQVPYAMPAASNDSSPPGPRRSARTTKGQTTRFESFTTGPEYDNATAGINTLASAGHALYAMRLPPGFEQVGAFLTDKGWMQWTCPLPAEGR